MFFSRKKVIIHVGFGHSATTSLQENIFSPRLDFQYCGIPYTDCGGIFSSIKYHDEKEFDYKQIKHYVDEYIFKHSVNGKPIIISDETLTEQPEVYYTPRMMSHYIIASRLKLFFPKAIILFTIRNQFDYVKSLYFNLKRNYAYLSKRPIESFEKWFEGNNSQLSNLYLRNIDYSKAINAYSDVFGEKSIRVIPMEIIKSSPDGSLHYLKKLKDMLGLKMNEKDIDRFKIVRNKRMTFEENAALNLWADNNFQKSLVEIKEENNITEFKTPFDFDMRVLEKSAIIDKCAESNKILSKRFNLDLEKYSYPLVYF